MNKRVSTFSRMPLGILVIGPNTRTPLPSPLRKNVPCGQFAILLLLHHQIQFFSFVLAKVTR
jgi:hypothetical protein